MKTCKNCGYENPSDMTFCVKCGKPLSAKKTAKCPSCGADLKPDFEFCGVCGAPVTPPERAQNRQEAETPIQKNICKACGALIADDALFCMVCGARVDKNICPSCGSDNDADARYCFACGGKLTPAQNEKPNESEAPAKPAPSGKTKAPARQRLIEFETRNRLIANLVVAVLSFILIFVGLFAPVMVFDTAQITYGGENHSKQIEVEQSVWQIVGALGAIDLDANDPHDQYKIREIANKYQEKLLEIRRKGSYNLYSGMYDRYFDVYADMMSDINMIELMLAVSGPGAYDYLRSIGGYDTLLDTIGEGTEKTLSGELDTMRTEAIVTLIFALIAAFIQIAVSIVAFVFMILAFVGILRKKSVNIPAVFATLFALGWAGLAVTMFAPLLIADGALLAITVLTGLFFFGYALAHAIVTKKRTLYIVKRSVIAWLSLIAMTLLCDCVINFNTAVQIGSMRSETTVSAPIGAALDGVITALVMNTIYFFGGSSLPVLYSSLTIASGVITLVLGVCAFMLLGLTAEKAMYRLIKYPESKSRFSVEALLSMIMLLLLVTVPPILGVADNMPVVIGASMCVGITASAGAPVYTALVFTVAVFVLGLVLNPRHDNIGSEMNSSLNYKESPVNGAQI